MTGGPQPVFFSLPTLSSPVHSASRRLPCLPSRPSRALSAPGPVQDHAVRAQEATSTRTLPRRPEPRRAPGTDPPAPRTEAARPRPSAPSPAQPRDRPFVFISSNTAVSPSPTSSLKTRHWWSLEDVRFFQEKLSDFNRLQPRWIRPIPSLSFGYISYPRACLSLSLSLALSRSPLLASALLASVMLLLPTTASPTTVLSISPRLYVLAPC
jgi:hypothetical protein